MLVSRVVSPRRLLAVLVLCALPSGCEDPGSGGAKTVAVVHGDESREVALDRLEAAALGVPVADVVATAWPELDLAATAVDFISADGFRPASRSPCQGLVPVAGALLDQGYLDPATADLTWEEAFDYPGCLHPNGVATIVALDVGTRGATVTLAAGEAQVDVDLSLLPTEDVGGEALVWLDVVATASGVVDAPHLFDYDFEGADGFRPTASGELAPLAWSFLTSGWIHPATRDLTWDAALGLEDAWSVEDVAIIHLVEKENDPASVRVVHGADEAEVALGDLDVVRVGADNFVLLQAVIEAAALVEDPSVAWYDFEGSDGYRVVEGYEDRVPAPWPSMGLGWIHPISRNLEWDASLDLSSPWFVHDVAIIYIVDAAQ